MTLSVCLSLQHLHDTVELATVSAPEPGHRTAVRAVTER